LVATILFFCESRTSEISKIIVSKEKPIGKSWKEVTSAAPWRGRRGHQCVTFDNKIWLIGGEDSDYKNDVWCTPPE